MLYAASHVGSARASYKIMTGSCSASASEATVLLDLSGKLGAPDKSNFAQTYKNDSLLSLSGAVRADRVPPSTRSNVARCASHVAAACNIQS